MVHILRREHVSDNCFSALGWPPESQRVRQRSKTSWRRTIERKKNKAGKSWKAAKAVAFGQRVLVRKRDDLTRLLTRSDDEDET